MTREAARAFADPGDTPRETCDLCIIGAGLNALAVACECLPKHARTVLFDAKPRPGRM